VGRVCDQSIRMALKDAALGGVASVADTATPTNTSTPMEMETESTRVHESPSYDRYPSNVCPERMTLTHRGNDCEPLAVVVEVDPPIEERLTSSAPPSSSIIMKACLDPAAKLSRIMTPACAEVSVFSMLVILATISPSPER